MANYSGDDYMTGKLNQLSELSSGIAKCHSALNIVLSMTASLGNVLILVALRKVSSVHPPTKLLFQSLAASDLCVGLISQPFHATRLLNDVTRMNTNIAFYIKIVNIASKFTLCGVSVLTSTAISVDRLLALLLRLRYRHVTLRRVRAVVICLWLLGVLGGLLVLIWNETIMESIALVFVVLSVVISVSSYTKIFLTLRQHQAQVDDHVQRGQPNGGGIPINTARYKETVLSIAWVQLALVTCYIPYVICEVIIKITGWSGLNAYHAWTFTTTLLYLNSSLNPILYFWKIEEVRQAVKDTANRVCCFFCSSI